MDNTVGKKITSLRKQSKVSQEELAFELGVSRQTVSNWESGNISPKWENITSLSEFFKVDPDYFMEEDNENPDYVPHMVVVNAKDLIIINDSLAESELALSYPNPQKEELKPISKKKSKKLLIAVIVIALTVAISFLSFLAYLYAPEEGAFETIHSSTWNFDDLSTLLGLIAGLLALILICIGAYLIHRHIKNKKIKNNSEE